MTRRFWDPFQELEALRREFDRAFSRIGREWTRLPARTAVFLPGRAERSYPLVNMTEDRDNIYVAALAPGLNPDTLNVSVVGTQLTIAGEKPAAGQNVKPESWHRNERAAGRFVRVIELPVAIDSDKVSAEYVNGILKITLAKAEAAKPKQIAISVN